MNPRFLAILESGKQKDPVRSMASPSDIYGSLVFSKAVVEQMLPAEVYQNLSSAMDGLEKIKPEYADAIAVALKDWAIAKGASHYTHWFHPLTGTSAEKHDAFIEPGSNGFPIERFTGKELLVGEPDASSFPSGGLRNTYEARGYTGWDPTSPIFIWKRNDGNTLCIPSVYYSWTGDVLDTKIPLLRSDKKINDACMRLLKLTGIEAKQVFSTLGCEQEYFLVSQSLFNLRQDLIQTGRTLFGRNSPKGQELQDHYLGSLKDKVLDYMRDFEESAFEVGIPIKTRHNEVAPAQYEVAPTFEKSSLAVDHNILLMDIMKKTAINHGLECLLHEKPFAMINGSGKHCNWSLSTDKGLNLLDPSDSTDSDLHFLILLAAILQGIHRHAGLLRASIASASNDHRLGGHEAPPSIISVYLGCDLERLLDTIENGKIPTISPHRITHDLGIHVLPPLPKDTTDRNRTSPFAFTGNKFEFRAVGSSADPAISISVLNCITAEALNEILDHIEAHVKKGKKLIPSVFAVLKDSIISSKPIRFAGDNYSDQWQKEAVKRKLPILPKSVDAFKEWKKASTYKVFEGVLNRAELDSRYEIVLEGYVERILIELRCTLDILQTQIIPIAIKEQTARATSISLLQSIKQKAPKEQLEELKILTKAIETSISLQNELKEFLESVKKLPLEKKAAQLSREGISLQEKVRASGDLIEKYINDETWLLPKYRELLFIL